jgi:ribose 5-phosphate isomerase B
MAAVFLDLDLSKEAAVKIAIGCTRRGFGGKQEIVSHLRRLSHEVEDIGCHDLSAKVDHCDLARLLTVALGRINGQLAILIGRDGAGMCIAANKLRGLRAAVADDELTAAYIRERYQCNVLCLGADQHGRGEMSRIVASFLGASVASCRDAHVIEELMQIEGCKDACGFACSSRFAQA